MSTQALREELARTVGAKKDMEARHREELTVLRTSLANDKAELTRQQGLERVELGAKHENERSELRLTHNRTKEEMLARHREEKAS